MFINPKLQNFASLKLSHRITPNRCIEEPCLFGVSKIASLFLFFVIVASCEKNSTHSAKSVKDKTNVNRLNERSSLYLQTNSNSALYFANAAYELPNFY